MSYLYLPPDRNVLDGRAVTSIAGTPDSEYPLSWLTDRRPAYPIRFAAGSWGVSISVASQAVRLVALCNHSLDAAVTVGGSISGTITPGAPPVSGILRNPFLLLPAAVAGVTTITLSGTNAGPAIIGEAFAGDPLTLGSLQLADAGDEYLDNGRPPQGEWRNVPMHDDGVEWRRFSGSQVYAASAADQIIAFWQAQRGLSRPGLLVIDTAVTSDARVVLIEGVAYRFNDRKDLLKMQLSFLEYPRYRW